MLSLIFSFLVAAETEKPSLEIDGTPGLKFSGICVTKENGEEKAIEGVAPAKIFLDLNIKQCSIRKKDSKGELKVRLYHKQKLLFDKKLGEPSSGVSLVIPLF